MGLAWFTVGRKQEMPDKMNREGGPKIGPPLAESEKQNFSSSEHTSGLSEASAGSRYTGPSGPVAETGRFLLWNWGRFLLFPILLRVLVCKDKSCVE